MYGDAGHRTAHHGHDRVLDALDRHRIWRARRTVGSGRSEHWRSFALASVVFIAALVTRTVDESVCSDFPLGTHFLWHLLIAYLLYIVSRSLILRWRAVSAVDAQVTDGADDVGVPS